MARIHLGAALTILVAAAGTAHGQQSTLKGFASLPAVTFAPGPTSGQFTTPSNGVTPPYVALQPVQGFSSVLLNGDRSFTVLSDNGFGSKANSPDYVLRLYTIKPDFKTEGRGSGAVFVGRSVTLSDPDRKAGFTIVAERDTYPNSTIPVDPAIRQGRLLTGADFDIESFRQVADGTFWLGDEFGPFLIHVDATGKLLDPPIPLPNVNGFGPNPLVQSPSNPLLGTAAPNLRDSGGFEGLALGVDGAKLYTLLEGSLNTDPDPSRLLINEFDLAAKQYTGNQFFYRKAQPGYNIGEITAVNASEFLVIERDNNQGNAATFKKIFLINLEKRDADGFVQKTELVDLLAIDDPLNLSGFADANGKFRFPFVTIESVLVLNANTLAVLNDNNFPGSAGRTPGVPDNNEFILIDLANPLQLPSQAARP